MSTFTEPAQPLPRLRAEVVELLRRLVSCDTSNPPGRETQAAAILEDYLCDAGLDCERVAKHPDRANLVATLRGRGTGPSLAFLGHLDVVIAPREGWSVDPFAGIERDGAIWGRGTVDMKCQVAATAVALATLAREGFVPAGDLMLLLMADEEVGEAEVGSPYFVEARPDLRPDYVVGEGAGERYETAAGPVYLLDRGVKATASATLTVRGRAGDASLPAGSNALFKLSRLLCRLEDHRFAVRIPSELEALIDVLAPGDAPPEERLADARMADPALDRVLGALAGSVISPTIAESPAPQNVVPERASVRLSCIVAPQTTEDELERNFAMRSATVTISSRSSRRRAAPCRRPTRRFRRRSSRSSPPTTPTLGSSPPWGTASATATSCARRTVRSRTGSSRSAMPIR
jgi:acetylornithine deacetylase/succinyl-diaminopimelate desuccinylase-like protein